MKAKHLRLLSWAFIALGGTGLWVAQNIWLGVGCLGIAVFFWYKSERHAGNS